MFFLQDLSQIQVIDKVLVSFKIRSQNWTTSTTGVQPRQCPVSSSRSDASRLYRQKVSLSALKFQKPKSSGERLNEHSTPGGGLFDCPEFWYHQSGPNYSLPARPLLLLAPRERAFGFFFVFDFVFFGRKNFHVYQFVLFWVRGFDFFQGIRCCLRSQC